MGAFAVLALIAAAGGIYVAAGGGRKLELRTGVPRKVRFESGSTPANESRLRALFSSVRDEGGGVYEVTAHFDGTVTVPSGASVVGGDSIGAVIELWSAYLAGRHIGFAFNKSSADAIHRAYSPMTFRRSGQAYPSSWDSRWRPVYGDSFRKTVWGRFLSPHDETVADYMRGLGVYARAEPDPTYKRPDQWMRLATR